MQKNTPSVPDSSAIHANQLARALELYPAFAALLDNADGALSVRAARRGESLLGCGEVATHAFLPLAGVVSRYFVDASGKEVICDVMTAGTPAVLWASIIEQTPSKHGIAAVDSATVLCIPASRLLRAAEAQHGDARELHDALQPAMLSDFKRNSDRFDTLHGSSPTARFDAMRSDTPWMVDKLPKHVLASYMGITTVHLGRIRTHFGIGPAQARKTKRAKASPPQ